MDENLGIKVDAWGAVIQGLKTHLVIPEWRPVEQDKTGLDYIFGLTDNHKKLLLDFLETDSYFKLAEFSVAETFANIESHKNILQNKIDNDQTLTAKEKDFMQSVENLSETLLLSAVDQAKLVVAQDWESLYAVWHPKKDRSDNYLLTEVCQSFDAKMKERGIPNLEVSMTKIAFLNPFGYGSGSEYEYVVIQQKLDDEGMVSVALRFNSMGKKDVAVFLYLFERNTYIENRQETVRRRLDYLAGVLMLLAVVVFILEAIRYIGLPASARHLGNIQLGSFFMIVISFFSSLWLFWQGSLETLKIEDLRLKYSNATIHQQFESRALASVVTDTFLGILEDMEIAEEQIRVIRDRQEEGMSNLTVPVENLRP